MEFGAPCTALRVHVLNNLVLGIWGVVIIVQVLGKVYDYWVLGPLGVGITYRLGTLVRDRNTIPPPRRYPPGFKANKDYIGPNRAY